MKPGSQVSNLPLRSVVPGLRYPAMSDPRVLPILGLLYQLERAQWMRPEHHRPLLFSQLEILLQTAFKTVAHYHQTLGDVGYNPEVPLNEEAWARIPILTRKTLQEEGKRLLSSDIPQMLQPFKQTKSSGSTGMPVEVFQPVTKGPVMAATAILEPLIQGADFSKKTAAIRHLRDSSVPPTGISLPDWGAPTSILLHTGPSAAMDSSQDPERQADWAIKEDPAYLQMFPSNLEALLPILKDKGASLPGLEYFRTMGEQLPDRIREDVRAQFDRKIVDVYSTQEVGLIALQCSENDNYHLMQDMVFTEILREDGSPCAPGEVGRIVVTDLFNPAFPLIRYEIGDLAEVGEPCPCGRSWPTLSRIMGRVRNLITYPDGRREWPTAPSKLLSEAVPMSQYQIIQTSLTALTVNLVMKRPLLEPEKVKVVEITKSRLGSEFDVTINEVDKIDRGASGKYEEFRSDITPEMFQSIHENH